MNRINFACQRKRWLRVLVVATLVSLNLAQAQAQDITQQLAGLSWVLCRRPGRPQIEPRAGQWKTWVITSGSQVRLPPPPHGSAQVAEVRNLITRAGQRDAAALDAISFWDAGPPSYRWNEIAVNQLVRNNITGPRSARVLSLLNVAIYDATVAAWDSKYVYNRPRPSEVSSRVDPAIPVPNSPSYPSEHAAAASAAAAVLGYLFPNDAQTFADQAQECGESRVNAGVQFPSDVSAGMELGSKAAELVIARAKTDGSDAVFTGSIPTGPGFWRGTNPNEPLAGTWRTWVISSGSEFRPPPPPAFDSAQKAQELAEVKNFPRPIPASGANFNTTRAAYFWQGNTAKLWNDILTVKLFEYQLDRNPPRAARAYALMNIAAYDAIIACWDGKYTYWAARPNMLDPTIVTLFPNPNHPSYPSAHSMFDGPYGEMLGYLFPRDAAYFTEQAQEAGTSRIWAGIHFRSDIEAGLGIGRAVGQKVIEWAKNDGSQ
ncbi:MAG TPA: vanadium-dependent haloperoxidase [Blastocatellia bacterium]|nr:vanadium-dependent haloperoxidase [Blastocatellia bacterium]